MTEQEKQILLDWCKTFDVNPINTLNLSSEAVVMANEIYSKFQKFISWSEDKVNDSKTI